jgi:hypothetical protein
LTQKSTILVFKIVVNDNFLSLRRIWRPPPSSPLKKKKNKVWYQNIMFKNYRDQLPKSFKRWRTKMNFSNKLKSRHSCYPCFLLKPSFYQFNPQLQKNM